MYVTRRLSFYKQSPSALSLPPPEGPNSGILVILDEEAEPTCCFGLCKTREVRHLPFPQNKKLEVSYTISNGQSTTTLIDPVIFIPVLGLPLSSNQYYAIKPHGKHKGEAFTSSTEEDVTTCCFCRCIKDVKPQPLNPEFTYQHFEIQPRKWGGFTAKSTAPDGVPPSFLRRKGWSVGMSTPRDFTLGEASGLDATLRARLPDFNFPLSQKSSLPVVVGKWYCPFIFVKEGTLKSQVKGSLYYEMTLEQRWEQIFTTENRGDKANSFVVEVDVRKEMVLLAGREAQERGLEDGVMWFRISINGEELNVGLHLAIFEKMKWEEERFGWIAGNHGSQERIKRTEEFAGNGKWRNLGCYVLAERFVLKRMDGSLVLTYDFKHTHQIRSKWEA